MAEPDNFEEDLFADLYTEDDSAAKPESAPPEVKVEPVAQVVPKIEESAVQTEPNGHQDEHMFNGEQDMDDEIDFNLGNGNGNHYDEPAHHERHGPGIKEDG